VPYIEVVHDRGAVEISRGCSRGCRFCSAGIIYRPMRERPREEVLSAIDELIQNCGYDEVSLVSLSSGDYSRIDELVAAIAQKHGQDLSISLPSLRLDEHSVRLVDSLPSRRKSGLTFAPEAASPRLQRVINKHIPEDELLATASFAFERGWTGLKLYFMLGLPTETDKDAEYTVQLVKKVQALGSRAPGRTPQIRLSLSTFVPKPHTPFQWVAQEKEEELGRKHELLRKGLQRKGVKLSWQEPKLSLLEATLSRGDRRLGKVIYHAWKLGSVFDAWNECFNYENWLKAFAESSLDPAFYAHRERERDELLPWSHIDSGVPVNFLKLEYERALTAKDTPDCRFGGCNACGLQRWYAPCQQKFAQLKEARNSTIA
jgi:radical SAM superfamily enzyme YgiQ (UPF0313 family)